jgi:hypothetical protein
MDHTLTLDENQERGLAEESKRSGTDPEVLLALYAERGLGTIVAELNQADQDIMLAQFEAADTKKTKAEILAAIVAVKAQLVEEVIPE